MPAAASSNPRSGRRLSRSSQRHQTFHNPTGRAVISQPASNSWLNSNQREAARDADGKEKQIK